MQNVIISREMLFSMPSWTMILTYLTFALSVIAFSIGISRKIKFVTNGKGLGELKKILPKKLYWGAFFKTLFLQGKVTRNLFVGFFHSSIFISFLILTVTTTIVAIHQDTPLKIFTGNIYILFSILADFAGLFLFIGLIIAFYRRFILRPKHLEGSNNTQDMIMYLFLSNFIIIGFLLESIRLIQTGMPIAELTYSPIGFLLAKALLILNISETVWTPIYQVLWMLHMLTTMLFIGMIPFTKFFHILIAPFQALITDTQSGSILLPMDFECLDLHKWKVVK